MTAEGDEGTLEVEEAVGLLQEHSRHPDQQGYCELTQNPGRGIQKAPGSTDLSSSRAITQDQCAFTGQVQLIFCGYHCHV